MLRSKTLTVRLGLIGLAVCALAALGVNLLYFRQGQLFAGSYPHCSERIGEHQATALMLASQAGDAPGVALLLRHGCEVNARDAEGMSALHYAATSGEWFGRSTRLLVDAGANLNATDKYGRTPLITSFTPHSSKSDILVLIKAGANPNLQDSTGDFALRLAADDGLTDIVEKLLDAGANPNLQRKDGRTALMEAALDGNLELAKLLVRRGADLRPKDSQGRDVFSFNASFRGELVPR